MPPSAASQRHADLAGRIVGLANLYRLLAALVLLAVHWLTLPTPAFGALMPGLFVLTLAVYFALGVVLTINARRWTNRRLLVLCYALVDTAAIAMLLYTSGGVTSGLAILLVIPVGAMGLLADRRDSLLVASIGSLAILAQQIALQLNGLAFAGDYPLTGLMGAVVFLVALVSWPVATRLRDSEALVRRQEIDLANLAQLSQYIVQHLRESILVIDPTDRIRLINESAAQLLGETAAVPGALLGEVSPRLLYLLATWRQRHESADPGGTLTAVDGARVLEPHFVPLGVTEPTPVLAFLEDTGLIAVKVQQSKLAALGRLSASIAHEIRNPVGAMSHAAELLGESGELGAEERRLTEIMRANAKRVSTIIDSVLRLSRRELPRPERITLSDWCSQFCTEFCATVQCPPEQLQQLHLASSAEVQVDPDQLHQIVWNLCQNALLHGQSAHASEPVLIRTGRLGGAGRPFLEVADRGPGVAEEDRERIFEPFFTRGERNTGLGLFLARELAESNGATLLHANRDGGGSVFRLVFSDPLRWAAATMSGEPGR
jgi:two-component system, NtrC family, sensor histidine kinase PilS